MSDVAHDDDPVEACLRLEAAHGQTVHIVEDGRRVASGMLWLPVEPPATTSNEEAEG